MFSIAIIESDPSIDRSPSLGPGAGRVSRLLVRLVKLGLRFEPLEKLDDGVTLNCLVGDPEVFPLDPAS